MALNLNSDAKTWGNALEQMQQVFVPAGTKLEKKPKAETALEMFQGIQAAKELTKNKKVKSAALTPVKRKTIEKVTAHLPHK
jgi:hypothetical protein